jgi:hypothetical protein
VTIIGNPEVTTSPRKRRTARAENRFIPYEDEFKALGVRFEYAGVVDIAEIERHPDSQSRIRETGRAAITAMSVSMKAGQIFPPPTIWPDGVDGYSLLDGNTRVAAKRKLGIGATDAYIVEVDDKDDAVTLSAVLNALNGQPLNKEERDRAMMSMARKGFDNKTISKKLGIPTSAITRALASQSYDERADRIGLDPTIADAVPKSIKARIQPLADDAVFTALSALFVEGDLTSNDLTPVLVDLKAAGSEADRLKVISDERANRAADIVRVSTGRSTKGSPVLESTRAVGSLVKLMATHPTPMSWVPASEDKRIEWAAQYDVLVPFLEQVRVAFHAENNTGTA